MGSFSETDDAIQQVILDTIPCRDWDELRTKSRSYTKRTDTVQNGNGGHNLATAVCETTTRVGRISAKERKLTHKTRVQLYALRYAQGCDIYTGDPLSGPDFVEWLLETGLAADMPKSESWITVSAWLACFPALWGAFRKSGNPLSMLLDLWSNGLSVSRSSKADWVLLEAVPLWLAPKARECYQHRMQQLAEKE